MTPADRTVVRRDIQALRALAVSMVVVYHFWPGALPGGFVGVDVFFVISGYLITTQLYRRPPTTVRGLTEFWSRRVMRLIPAATAAILGTLVLVLVLQPSSEWVSAAEHAAASMLYVENWLLVREATDYLRADAAPSPFQHYWSLSVEEQFYLVWPLLVGLAVLLSRPRPGRRRQVMLLVVTLAALASFVHGLLLTDSDPAAAYFASPARMWELAAGGVLALLHAGGQGQGSSRSRTALAWAGLAALVASCVVITGSTPFPGWAALLPTLGTLALLHAQDPDGRFTLRRAMHARGVQLVGDVSYAAYLWHWPLVLVLAPALAPEGIAHEVVKLALLPVLLVIAWLSMFVLEDPFRRIPPGGSLRKSALVAVVLCTALVLGAAGAIAAIVDRRTDAVQSRVDALVSGLEAEPCVGAAAMAPGADCPADAPLITTPDFARTDLPSTVKNEGCLNWPPFAELVTCSFGDPEPSARIAVLGDSHGGHLVPALEAIADDRGWQVDTFVIGACRPSVEPVPQFDAVNGSPPDEVAEGCARLTAEAFDRAGSGDYALAVISAMDHDPSHDQPEGNIYRSTLDRLTDAGVPVLVVRDPPAPLNYLQDTPTCLGANPTDPGLCDGTPGTWIRQDPLTSAALASDSPLVHRVDLNQYVCTETVCKAVVGGVIVYGDFNHFTTTFARTLAPYLEPAVLEAMQADPAATGSD